MDVTVHLDGNPDTRIEGFFEAKVFELTKRVNVPLLRFLVETSHLKLSFDPDANISLLFTVYLPEDDK